MSHAIGSLIVGAVLVGAVPPVVGMALVATALGFITVFAVPAS